MAQITNLTCHSGGRPNIWRSLYSSGPGKETPNVTTVCVDNLDCYLTTKVGRQALDPPRVLHVPDVATCRAGGLFMQCLNLSSCFVHHSWFNSFINDFLSG